MHVDDCYQLGYIVKPHGLKGEVQVLIDSDDPQAYQNLESVFVQQGQQLVPFFIESISLKSQKAIVAFEDIHRVEEAAPLKGKKLFLPLAILPELEGDEFYLHELVGFQVVDASNDQGLGEIKNVLEMGPQLTLVIEHLSGKELLLPYSEELKVKLDKEHGILHLAVAVGLVDLYLAEHEN
jgi:16S rRNA processing protein RimM